MSNFRGAKVKKVNELMTTENKRFLGFPEI